MHGKTICKYCQHVIHPGARGFEFVTNVTTSVCEDCLNKAKNDDVRSNTTEATAGEADVS